MTSHSSEMATTEQGHISSLKRLFHRSDLQIRHNPRIDRLEFFAPPFERLAKSTTKQIHRLPRRNLDGLWQHSLAPSSKEIGK